MVQGQRLRQESDGHEGTFPRLLGGQLCLNFVNTLDPRAGDQPRDFLGSYADLVGWARYAGILTAAQADGLVAAGASEPTIAESVFAQAIDLREAMHRTFLAITRGSTPAQDDLATLKEAYWTALASARLSPSEGGFDWVWMDDRTALDRPLWAIARSAVDLLTSPEVGRVKACANHGCGWLFFDSSKNGSRRWCSMEGCGSRAKMRRYNARKRQSE
jgi:predicted RNA-binding Zn ribbon-like protein